MNYAELAAGGMPAEQLAEVFLDVHFEGAEPEYPVNPFKILRDCGVVFSFRAFNKYEGLYLPAEDENDLPVVGINLSRPITRQRFTAAHELCHHLKDASSGVVCPIGFRSKIEKYAEKFAACLLMPRTAVARQISVHSTNGFVTFEDVLKIANYFGVSFAACLNRLAFDFHAIKGNPSAAELGELRSSFKPDAKRKTMGMTDVVLYRQLFDVAGDLLEIEMAPMRCQRFKTEYIYHDSRMEGIEVDQETAAEIAVDLRMSGSNSVYCSQNNEDIIEVAGLVRAYEYVFDHAIGSESISVYDAKSFNEQLYSLSPFPECGGRFRESNTLVLGAKFETVDYRSIPAEFLSARRELDRILDDATDMTTSEYIEAVVKFHHRLTVLHPFRDGNGRSTRGLANLLFVRRGLPPVLFINSSKNLYKEALAIADKAGNFDNLFCVFFKQMLSTYATLTDTAL